MTIGSMLLGRVHIWSIATLLGLPVTTASASDGQPWRQVPQARLFATNEKIYGGVELVAGNIVYIAEKGAEGYRPQKVITVNGSLSQKVYDYPANLSALFVFGDLKAQILENRFEILHECAGMACGDVDAWRLFLHRSVAGDSASQHYLLAKQPGRNSDQYVQVHAVDIGNRPRAVLSMVKEGARPPSSMGKQSDPSSPNPTKVQTASSVSSVLFEAGRAALVAENESAIVAIATSIREQRVSRVELIGHTDDSGSPNSNRDLSWARAQAVAESLRAQPGMEALHIAVAGHGAFQPIASNGVPEGRAQNRRVEVHFVKTDQAAALPGSTLGVQ